MKISTTALNNLRSRSNINLRTSECNDVSTLGGETRPLSPHDLGFGNAPNHHGSFEGYQGSVSSATAMDSQEIFFDALEEAPVAYLDPERRTRI
jgi:hypothetical protein